VADASAADRLETRDERQQKDSCSKHHAEFAAGVEAFLAAPD
jgi:hypothetical protein